MRTIQIAIDGPAGAGKSTIAKLLAEKLGFVYVDSGAMYRVITYEAINKGKILTSHEALANLAAQTQIDFLPAKGVQLVFANGKDVTKQIREPEVSQQVSLVASVEGVRKELVKKQQMLAKNNDVVMDGRDIGTVVLPNAECKIFLTASLAERARRRHRELLDLGYTAEYDKIKQELAQRDVMDQNRAVSPLRVAEDAIIIDTTKMELNEIVKQILDICKQKRSKRNDL